MLRSCYDHHLKPNRLPFMTDGSALPKPYQKDLMSLMLPLSAHPQGPVLTEHSWVNLFTLSGLGLPISGSSVVRRRLLGRALHLPHFEDGTPWNACVDGAELV
eukprot:scaffold388452_cov48-Prasinocladus_malaysianus.AAC.1